MQSSEIEVGLAPMEGVTCFATRLWFSLTSRPSFAISPFLRITQGFPTKRISKLYVPEVSLLKNYVSYALIPQLMGSEPVEIARIAEHLLQETSFVDVNCGCPSPTVVGHHAGSGVLETTETFYKFIQQLVTHIGKNKFSIKMRSGFHSDEEFSQLLNVVSHVDLAQLTLHARTRVDKYKGKARWDLIQQAAKNCHFPVIGSGDIINYETFLDRFNKAPNIKKIIIGRGALRNPWVFNEIRYKTNTVINSKIIVYSLAVFALLHELQAILPEKLIAFVVAGNFLKSCELNEDYWEDMYKKLSELIFNRIVPINSLVFERPTFSKVKMLWNYMRSSFPIEFMDPSLLRAKVFSEFIYLIMELTKKLNIDNEITLKYNSSFDWIYSGETNNNKPT